MMRLRWKCQKHRKHPKKGVKAPENAEKTSELMYLEKMADHLHKTYGDYLTADDISQMHPAMIQAESLLLLLAIFDEIRALRQLVKTEN